jgi:hypothetical protein
MKRLFLAALVLAGALGISTFTAPAADAGVDCRLVLCPPCPTGQVLEPRGNDCCRCVTP